MSANNPEFVVLVVVAFATVPTLIDPAEFSVTFPPTNVVAPIVQPPIKPNSAFNVPPVVTLNGALANVA